MNIKATKHIYISVLIYKYKIRYLGDNKYKLIWYYDNWKASEKDYKNGKLHGRNVGWFRNGFKCWDEMYINDVRNGKSIRWFTDGRIMRRTNYLNGIEL